MRVTKVSQGGAWLPPGKISISQDGRRVKIEDLRISDGFKLNELEVDVNLLPKILSKISSGDVTLNIKEFMGDTKFQIQRFKVTLSESYLKKVVKKLSSKELRISGAEIKEGAVKLQGYFDPPLLPPIPFKTSLIPEVDSSGNLSFLVDKVSVLSIPLPSFFKALGLSLASALGIAKDKVQVHEDKVTLSLKGIKFKSLKVTKDALLVEGKVDE